ncbi:hypothetical protein ACIA98_03230 [Streptomyces sp. NPDC051366]|uniref:hypothetical protein n=1 Tax=Streptomyces sp. NPDC051366 TaxID=3365652 RepID=UPI0037A6F3BC
MRRDIGHGPVGRTGQRARGPRNAVVAGAAPPGRPIGAYDDELVLRDLEVHPALESGGGAAGLGSLPVYVRRTFDDRLGEAVAAAERGRSGIAMLVGDSSTGKTRACWEAVRNLPAPWRIWHPVEPSPAAALWERLDGVAPHTVVWLNEARDYLLDPTYGPQNAAALRELLHDGARGPVLVLGTLWRKHWEILSAVPAASAEPDAYAQTRRLVGDKSIRVPEAFTEAELRSADAAALEDPRVAEALRDAGQGQLTQYLAGAPELVKRYRNATVAAQALIEAAMDARRLGHGRDLPPALLEAAVPGYVTDQQWTRIARDPDWLAEALRPLEEDCRGVLGPLTRHHPRPAHPQPPGVGYRLADYLEQVADRERKDVSAPPELWQALLDHGKPEDRVALRRAARERGLYRLAFAFDVRRAEDGEYLALLHAGHVLKDTHRYAEATAWFELAARTDTEDVADQVHAMWQAARLLDEAGRVDEAIAWYRRVAEDAPDGMNAMWAVIDLSRSASRVEGTVAWLRGLAARTGAHVHRDGARAAEEADMLLEDVRALEAGRVGNVGTIDAGAAHAGAAHDTASRAGAARAEVPYAMDDWPMEPGTVRRWIKGVEVTDLWEAAGAAARAGRIGEAVAWYRKAAELDDDGATREAADLLTASGRRAEGERLRRYGWEPVAFHGAEPEDMIARPWDARPRPPGDRTGTEPRR